MCEKMPSENRTREVIGARPNTCHITKALAERLLEEERGDLPVSVVRPTIVMGAMKEPVPGWVVNMDGPTRKNNTYNCAASDSDCKICMNIDQN